MAFGPSYARAKPGLRGAGDRVAADFIRSRGTGALDNVGGEMRIADMNWMQVEDYLARDDRIVLPVGSTEQHGYLSLAVDLILAERISVEAAEPLAVPVLPVMPFGVAPGFTAYPGTVSLRLETLVAVLTEALESLYGQGFRRFLVVNGHGGNTGAEEPLVAWARERDGASLRFHSWWASDRTMAAANALYPDPTHANWFENFPWTRLEGVTMPAGEKPMATIDEERGNPARVREILGDGTFGGAYERRDEDMLKLWSTAVEEVRELLDAGW
jgi:creatinine amidohydrolase